MKSNVFSNCFECVYMYVLSIRNEASHFKSHMLLKNVPIKYFMLYSHGKLVCTLACIMCLQLPLINSINTCIILYWHVYVFTSTTSLSEHHLEMRLCSNGHTWWKSRRTCTNTTFCSWVMSGMTEWHVEWTLSVCGELLGMVIGHSY